MSDYIERQAVIDAIHCDITITGRQNAELVASTIGTFVDSIKALPSADVVQVVRCKDCRYFRKFLRECERSGALTMYPLHDTDFCSYGEREE